MFKDIDNIVMDNENTKEIIKNINIKAELIYENFPCYNELYYIEFYIREDHYNLYKKFEDKEWTHERVYFGTLYGLRNSSYVIPDFSLSGAVKIRIALPENYNKRDLVNLNKLTSSFNDKL